jgi:hypothetical protein
MVDDRTLEHDEPIVVTIFETYGAGADTIGRRVAASLGATFHEQAFSSEELERAEASWPRRTPGSSLHRQTRAV